MTRPSISCALALSLLLVGSAAAQQTFTVDVTYDAPDVAPGDGVCADAAGRCTLRAAIMEANASPGDETILLPSGTLTLTVAGNLENAANTGDLDLTDAGTIVTIRGAGRDVTILSGLGLGDRMFELRSGTAMVLEDLSIQDAAASPVPLDDSGGAFSVSGASLVLTSCRVARCHAPNTGGVAAVGNTASLQATDCLFEINTAGLQGGGIAAFDASTTVSLTSCAFSGHDAPLRGSAVYTNVGCTLQVDLCTFQDNGNNSPISNGGAVWTAGPTTIADSTFVDNGASNGAALFSSGFAAQSFPVEVRRSTFSHNAASAQGSAITNFGNAMILEDCTFTDNTSLNIGTVFSAHGTMTVSRCTFLDNVASGSTAVGANVPLVVSDCLFVGNVAANGSILSTGDVTSVTRCVFRDNTGTAIGVFADLSVADSTVSGHDRGAVRLVSTATAQLTNVTIAGNSSPVRGAGIRVDTGASLSLESTTIVGNGSTQGAGGIDSLGTVVMRNTVLAGNTGATYPDGASNTSVVSAGHNLIGDATGFGFAAAAGDLVGSSSAPLDPQLGPLQNNGGPLVGTPQGTRETVLTHAPLAGSPVIDAGDNAGAPATDQRGFARLFDGDGDGVAVIDIGAVESDLPPPNAPPTADAGPDQAVRAGDTVQLDGNASFDDNTATAQLLWSWTFTSKPAGSTAVLVGADTATPSFTTDLAGTYVVELVVTDEGGLPSAPDSVAVSTDNLAPTAVAGDDQLVITGSFVALDGNASSDPESDPLTFQWSLVSAPAGSTASLSNASSAIAQLVPDVGGVYTIALVVSDPIGPGPQDVVTITATSAAGFAEAKVLIAAVALSGATPAQVTNQGNQNALLNFLAQAIVALQAGDLVEAADKLQKAIERTDGCVERGAPDGNGPGRDWVIDCALQSLIYTELSLALLAITP